MEDTKNEFNSLNARLTFELDQRRQGNIDRNNVNKLIEDYAQLRVEIETASLDRLSELRSSSMLNSPEAKAAEMATAEAAELAYLERADEYITGMINNLKDGAVGPEDADVNALVEQYTTRAE